jgi:hypothetical protein
LKGIEGPSLFPRRFDIICIEIFVDFIKRRPTSVLELVFQDAYGVKHKSRKFKEGDLVHWNFDMSAHFMMSSFSVLFILYRFIKTHTYATLTLRRALFKIRVAEIELEFEPNVFGDNRTVGLEGCCLFSPSKILFTLSVSQISTIALP